MVCVHMHHWGRLRVMQLGVLSARVMQLGVLSARVMQLGFLLLQLLQQHLGILVRTLGCSIQLLCSRPVMKMPE